MEPITTFSRIAHPDTTENNLLARTLQTSTTVRACKSFLRRSVDSGTPRNQVYMLFSLGRDLNGIAGYCHGAVISLMLDEATGQLMACECDRDQMITAQLNVKFRQPIKTPNVVLCRSWIEREPEKRKLWIKGEVSNGVGGIYADADALFMKRREAL